MASEAKPLMLLPRPETCIISRPRPAAQVGPGQHTDSLFFAGQRDHGEEGVRLSPGDERGQHAVRDVAHYLQQVGFQSFNDNFCPGHGIFTAFRTSHNRALSTGKPEMGSLLSMSVR